MAILGIRGTGDWGTDERPKNFRETILWRQPNGQTPLTALLSKMGSESTNDPEFAWWEEQLNTMRVQLNGAIANGVITTLVIQAAVDTTNLVAGDLLLVEKADSTTYDNEIVEVASVTNATTFKVIRGAAGTTPVAIADASYLTKIGNVYSEGSGAPTSSTRNPTKLSNFCQIFKTTYELTNTAKGTNLRTGDPLKNDKKRKMFDHSIAMEWAFLFGQKSETTGGNGKPKRTTGGIRSFLASNVTVFGAAVTEDSLLAALYPVFNFSSGAGDERLILAGNGAINVINKVAKNSRSSRVNFDGVVKLYGMSLQRWITPQGVFYLKSHPLMNNHARYTNSAFVIDPSALKYRHFRDTAFKDNIQAPDSDTQKGQWLTEAGLEVNHEGTMAYLGAFQ